MNNHNKLNHTTLDCKYHLIWIPKYRKKAIYGNLRKYLGEVLRELALHFMKNRLVQGIKHFIISVIFILNYATHFLSFTAKSTTRL